MHNKIIIKLCRAQLCGEITSACAIATLPLRLPLASDLYNEPKFSRTATTSNADGSKNTLPLDEDFKTCRWSRKASRCAVSCSSVSSACLKLLSSNFISSRAFLNVVRCLTHQTTIRKKSRLAVLNSMLDRGKSSLVCSWTIPLGSPWETLSNACWDSHPKGHPSRVFSSTKEGNALTE